MIFKIVKFNKFWQLSKKIENYLDIILINFQILLILKKIKLFINYHKNQIK